jgi:hypothetical protein
MLLFATLVGWPGMANPKSALASTPLQLDNNSGSGSQPCDPIIGGAYFISANGFTGDLVIEGSSDFPGISPEVEPFSGTMILSKLMCVPHNEPLTEVSGEFLTPAFGSPSVSFTRMVLSVTQQFRTCSVNIRMVRPGLCIVESMAGTFSINGSGPFPWYAVRV